MAIKIKNDCINSVNCKTKCPNKAINEEDEERSFSYGYSDFLFQKNGGATATSETLRQQVFHDVYMS
jgi:formate hydrogenlyase subunit 6/NADH:ubiquinone oxidoreductase subunit I